MGAVNRHILLDNNLEEYKYNCFASDSTIVVGLVDWACSDHIAIYLL